MAWVVRETMPVCGGAETAGWVCAADKAVAAQSSRGAARCFLTGFLIPGRRLEGSNVPDYFTSRPSETEESIGRSHGIVLWSWLQTHPWQLRLPNGSTP